MPTSISLTEKAKNQAGNALTALIALVRKGVDAAGEELTIRLSNGKSAFAAEMAWSAAALQAASEPRTVRTAHVRGLLIRVDDGVIQFLEPGTRLAQGLCSNDIVDIDGKKHLLKLFIQDRCAQRIFAERKNQ